MSNKILVVDDDQSILEAISLILEEEEYIVQTTTKGEEVYTKLHTFKPDLILLDVLMSGKDGREICKKIKSDEKTKSIPIIMISAHPSAEKSIKECGAEDFLAKPFETKDLLQKISQFIS